MVNAPSSLTVKSLHSHLAPTVPNRGAPADKQSQDCRLRIQSFKSGQKPITLRGPLKVDSLINPRSEE
jgi:hypothetical protein